ncbi:peptidylprolyl isomerase [bacterium]|nr:peptidylprolyl isomerase [bacterium]
MRKKQVFTGFCCLICFCSLVFAQGGTQYVRLKSENLRDAPGGAKIGELTGGTGVEVLEKRPNWVKIQVTGWIWEPSLTPDPTLVDGFTVKASHILCRTETDAKDVLKRLKSGASFEEMAKQYSVDKSSASKGGSLGEFKRGDLLPEFEKAALSLKPGEISDVVKSPLGYHVIRRDR